MLPPVLLRSFWCIAAVFACTGGGEDGEPREQKPYADVVEWPCYEGPRDCWCPGLRAGDDSGSSEPRVEACSHTHCYVYRVRAMWMCLCKPEPFEPWRDWRDVEPVESCPP